MFFEDLARLIKNSADLAELDAEEIRADRQERSTHAWIGLLAAAAGALIPVLLKRRCADGPEERIDDDPLDAVRRRFENVPTGRVANSISPAIAELHERARAGDLRALQEVKRKIMYLHFIEEDGEMARVADSSSRADLSIEELLHMADGGNREARKKIANIGSRIIEHMKKKSKPAADESAAERSAEPQNSRPAFLDFAQAIAKAQAQHDAAETSVGYAPKDGTTCESPASEGPSTKG